MNKIAYIQKILNELAEQNKNHKSYDLETLVEKYEKALKEIKKSVIDYRFQTDPPIVVCYFLDEIIYIIREVLNEKN